MQITLSLLTAKKLYEKIIEPLPSNMPYVDAARAVCAKVGEKEFARLVTEQERLNQLSIKADDSLRLARKANDEQLIKVAEMMIAEAEKEEAKLWACSKK